MAEVATFRLTGRQAAVVGVGILAASAWGFTRHLQPVPAPARDVLHAWLIEDYTDPRLHRLSYVRENAPFRSNAGTIAALEAGADAAPTDTAEVAIDGVDGHGWPDFLVVRAAVSGHHGEDPPFHDVRYLSVSRGVNGRWTVFGESTAWKYWSVLIPAPRNGSSWP